MKEMASPARELLAIDPEAGKDEASSPDVNFNPQPPCDKLEVCYSWADLDTFIPRVLKESNLIWALTRSITM